MSIFQKRWLTPKEVEILYGIPMNQQAKLRCKSSRIRIPFSKIGKYIRYDKIDLDDWFESHKI